MLVVLSVILCRECLLWFVCVVHAGVVCVALCLLSSVKINNMPCGESSVLRV